MNIRPLAWLAILLATVQPAFAAGAAPAAPFTVAGKIPLPGVKGRIDHLAYDTRDKRLFVAELGNNSVSVIDVDARRVLKRLPNLPEPQGLAYFASKKLLYVSTRRDGTVRAFRAPEFGLVYTRQIGDDVDNIRIDIEAQQLYVGGGNGALAVLDLDSLNIVSGVPLKDHPESFQFSPLDPRMFVNVPGANEIAVVDRSQDAQIASWPVGEMRGNYAMALDHVDNVLLSVFRQPPKIGVYPLDADKKPQFVDTCGDADDIYIDYRRHRVYVICGEGVVDILELGTLKRLGRIPTSPGARTGFYSSDIDQLLVAAPAKAGKQAELWILKPSD